jgi:hypothetical protein
MANKMANKWSEKIVRNSGGIVVDQPIKTGKIDSEIDLFGFDSDPRLHENSL